MDNPTWENEEFRCSICLSIFSPVNHNQHEPVVVCENMHTFCRTCAQQHVARSSNCPQCRIQCRGIEAMQVNRFITAFIERMRMPCGSCALSDSLGYQEMSQHINECPGSKVLCPMPHNVTSGRPCHQVITASSMWEHCRSVHSSEVHSIDCVHSPDGDFTASLTLLITLTGKHNIFVSMNAGGFSVNLCFHVHVMHDDDNKSVICFALRRFYSERQVSMTKALLSIEVGDLYGMVLPLKSPMAPHVELQAHDMDQIDEVIRIPLSLFRCMQGSDSEASKATTTVQFFARVF